MHREKSRRLKKQTTTKKQEPNIDFYPTKRLLGSKKGDNWCYSFWKRASLIFLDLPVIPIPPKRLSLKQATHNAKLRYSYSWLKKGLRVEIIMQLLIFALLPVLKMILKAAISFWLIWYSSILLCNDNSNLWIIVLLGLFPFLSAQAKRNKYIFLKGTKSLEFTAFGENESDQRSTSLINSAMHIYPNGIRCVLLWQKQSPSTLNAPLFSRQKSPMPHQTGHCAEITATF